MDDFDDTPALFACTECGNRGIGNSEIRCCEQSMERQASPEVLEAPSIEQVMEDVFGVSARELDLCLCVMESDGVTVSEIADRTGYDRSVIARHLNHLAELGIVEKWRRILKQGGHVYVYTAVSEETVRSRLTDAFLAWATHAYAEVSHLEREKVESIADTQKPSAWKLIRDG